MKKRILRIVFIIIVIPFSIIILYLAANCYTEAGDTRKKQVYFARNKLFNVFLELKKVSLESKKIDEYKKIVRDQNFSELFLNDNYLCFVKEEDSPLRYCIAVFIGKNKPGCFYCFLINYKNLRVSYFNADGFFYVINQFDNDFFTDTKTNLKDNGIKRLLALILNSNNLQNISNKQLIEDGL